MTNEEQFLSVLRLFLRDFNRDVNYYIINMIDSPDIQDTGYEWTLYNRDKCGYMSLQNEKSHAANVYKSLCLKNLETLCTKNINMAEIIKEEFGKYPHILG